MVKYELFYDKVFEHNCLKACLYNYLLMNEYKEPLLYIDSSIHLLNNFDNDVFEGYTNIGLFKKYKDNMYFNYGEFDFVWEQDKQLLNRGISLIFDVDVYYLPYRKEYMKVHGSHGVICTNYMDNSMNIIDWCEPYFYNNHVDSDSLKKSRTSVNEYSGNPFSGMRINCFSLGIIHELKNENPEHAFQEWIKAMDLDMTVLKSLKRKIIYGSLQDRKLVSDFFYRVICEVKFACFFLKSVFTHKLQYIDILIKIEKETQRAYTSLLKYSLYPKSQYIYNALENIEILTTLYNSLLLLRKNEKGI